MVQKLNTKDTSKEVILFDAETCHRKRVTYNYIMGITGKSQKQLWQLKFKNRYIREINAYIMDVKAPLRAYKEILKNHKPLKYEIWREMGGGYKVSNYGRFRNSNGAFLLPNFTDGTMRIRIGKTMQVHSLVYKHFIGDIPDGYVVVHRDRDNKRCHADNLVLVKTGMQNAVYRGNRVPVVAVSAEGDVDVFDSVLECSKALYVGRDAIRIGLKDGKEHCGYRFYKENEYEGEII